jgi:hypothetical protein
MLLAVFFKTTHFNPVFLMSLLGYTDPLLPPALFLEFVFISPNSITALFRAKTTLFLGDPFQDHTFQSCFPIGPMIYFTSFTLSTLANGY